MAAHGLYSLSLLTTPIYVGISLFLHRVTIASHGIIATKLLLVLTESLNIHMVPLRELKMLVSTSLSMYFFSQFIIKCRHTGGIASLWLIWFLLEWFYGIAYYNLCLRAN